MSFILSGVVYDEGYLEDPWTVFYAAFRAFKRIRGTAIVPTKFTVPSQAQAESDDAALAAEALQWPRLTRGLPLGVRVAAVRSTGAYVLLRPERKRMLDDLGFLWSAKEYAKERAATSASTTSTDTSAEASTAASASVAAATQAIGSGDYSAVLQALEVYRAMHGTADVPEEYIVPTLDDTDTTTTDTTTTTSSSEEGSGYSSGGWPERLRGYPLGAAVQYIVARSKVKVHSAAALDALEAVDFPWHRSEREQRYSRAFDVILEALRTYKEVYGNLYVGQLFIVPSAAPWPEEAWGMRLGSRVATIRARESYIKGHPDRRYVRTVYIYVYVYMYIWGAWVYGVLV